MTTRPPRQFRSSSARCRKSESGSRTERETGRCRAAPAEFANHPAARDLNHPLAFQLHPHRFRGVTSASNPPRHLPPDGLCGMSTGTPGAGSSIGKKVKYTSQERVIHSSVASECGERDGGRRGTSLRAWRASEEDSAFAKPLTPSCSGGTLHHER